MRAQICRFIMAALLGVVFTPHLHAQSAAFTYQGELADNGNAANGLYDLQFEIYDTTAAGTRQGPTLEATAMTVTNGRFTVTLDFGANVFTGDARWLQISVRANGSAADFTVLNPRQPISATPYSLSARTLNGRDPSSFAGLAHAHAAEDITSGIHDTARLNVGTTSGTVAAGDHLHDDRYYTQTDLNALVAELQSKISGLEASVYTGSPPPPANLSATPISSSAITLNWSYYASAQEDGFRIERSIGTPTNFQEIALLPSDAVSFVNSVLIPSTDYYYRVSAYNASGNSGFSNLSSATTFATSGDPCNEALGILCVDPPVLPDLATFKVQLCVNGLSESNPAAEVKLVADNLTEAALVFSSPVSPDELMVTVPAGLPAGSWTVRVTAQNGDCGSLSAALLITNDLTLALDHVDPGHVSPSQSTPLTITSQSPPPPGGAPFLNGARSYLVPTTGGLSLPLDSGLFVDESTLTAATPPGLHPAVYDLVVVNPDGTVGLLPSGLTVLTNEPPEVTEVVPAFFTTSPGELLTLEGQGFVSPVQATLICLPPSGGNLELPLTVSATGPSSLTVVVDGSSVEPGSLCFVKVVNPDSGTAMSPVVSAATLSLSPNPWETVAELNEARRSPSLVAVGGGARPGILYAIGGDTGTTTASLATVESTSVDPFGHLSGWTYQSQSLPEGRCFAGAASVGPFVYLAGGRINGNATSSVLRAMLLDEASTPAAPDFVVRQDPGASPGVSAGTVGYRVSVLSPPGDSLNPGGESLPGGIRQVTIPAISDLAVDLSWPAVPNAFGYRVYKASAAADFELLAEIKAPANSFRDTGAPTNPSERPLPEGSLGVWHAVASMTTAREGHTVVAAPRADAPGQHTLYAIGGRNPAGVPQASIESLSVNEDGQVGPSWTTLSATLSTARADLGAWLMRSADSPSIPSDDYWLYVGPGKTASGFSSVVEGTRVLTGGALQALATTGPVSGNWAGYAALVEKDRLYLAAGLNGASTTTRGAGPTGVFPNLSSWNNLGLSLVHGRVYPGFARVNGHLFILGGADGSGTPLASVERAVK